MAPAAMEVVDVLKSLNAASMTELGGNKLPDDCWRCNPCSSRWSSP
jgi:hypothetical protein